MKISRIPIYPAIFNNEIFMILLIFILKFIRIKSFENFKTIYLSNNNYLIIKQHSINYYSNNQLNEIKAFNESQMITTTEELDNVNFGIFKDEGDSLIAHLLIVKDYIYAIQYGRCLCDYQLNKITNVLSTEVFPYKCISYTCFYIIGVMEKNKSLFLYLYKNPADSCSSTLVASLSINNVAANLNCQFMISSDNQKVLTCFSQNSDRDQMLVKSFSIDTSTPSIQEISSLSKTKDNNGVKVIKSIVSGDGKKSFVCFINKSNETECLIYDITENTFSESSTYLSDCLPRLSSLNIEYMENANGNGEYVVYCFQSETKLNLVKFDSNFNKIEDNEENKIFDISQNVKYCTNFAASSLVHDSNNNLNIFIICDNIIKKVELGKNEPSETTIPTTLLKTTIPTTLLKTTIPTTLPKTTIPTTLLKTTIPTTLPKTTIPTNLAKTTIPTTLAKTTIPTTLPKTTIPTTLPKTTIPTKLQKTTILITLPKTTIPTTLPKTTIPTTLPKTTIPTTLPKTTMPTTLPKTKIPTTLAKTTIPTTLSKTTIPTTLPIHTTLPKTVISTTSISSTTVKTTILEKIFAKTTTISRSYSSIETTKKTSIINHPSNSIIESKNKDELVILHSKSNKTKEEIIDNLDTVMEDYDIGKIYEIIGDDYNVKISPINIKQHDEIATYIDFANCENILKSSKDLNESSLLTVYQIEVYNTNEQTLVNNVQYAVYNEKKQRLDLSVCKDEKITINYQLNTTTLNMTKVNYYYDKGIDVFNIEDDFFNDICYSYSEKQSDMILKDRVSDIYHNYSVCESNCKYKGVNLTENTVSCSCSIKTSSDSVVESPPRIDEIIRDSFVDSNLAVVKCYNLVFGLENKHQNIGFWIFTALIALHFPPLIHYFIYNITSIRKYIFTEMGRSHYLIFLRNLKQWGILSIITNWMTNEVIP